MKLKILIRTPKGQAQKAEKKLRLFLLKNKKPANVFVNDLDNEICWIVEGDPRHMVNLQDKVMQYDILMNMAFNNKLIKSIVKKKVGQEGADDLYDMLINQTEVEVIKREKEEELVNDKESVFYKMKMLFKKNKENDNNK